MTGRYFSFFIFARSSRMASWSSRNLRNRSQVSMGRRSRSPLRPLSFRMMSRADLTRLPRRWAVVWGWPLPFFFAMSFLSSGRRVEQGLELVDRLPELFRAAEQAGDLHHVTVRRDG